MGVLTKRTEATSSKTRIKKKWGQKRYQRENKINGMMERSRFRSSNTNESVKEAREEIVSLLFNLSREKRVADNRTFYLPGATR